MLREGMPTVVPPESPDELEALIREARERRGRKARPVLVPMSVVAPPPQDELELLIREARARQRRRRLVGAAAVALAAALGISLYAVLGGGATKPKHGTGSRLLASAPRCRAGQLRLSGGFRGAAAGNDWFLFAFTNTSATSCSMRGWPTVELRFPHGRSLVIRAHGRELGRGDRVLPVRRVVLRSHGSASFNLHVLGAHHPGGRACPQSSEVFASPPGSSVPLRARLARMADVPAVVWACAHEAWVAQVVPGKTNPDTSR
jgi:uncharacterized protein DUF4232